MKRLSLAIHCLVWCLIGLYPAHLWAASPNILLSRTLHFSSPDGTSVTLGPGKYYIEQFGTSELRLTPEGDKPTVTILAESLTHEQYELFSAMALTRPQKNDEFLIELLLPGGIRLEARGSTKAPPDPTKTATTATSAAPPPMVQEEESPITGTMPEVISPQTHLEDSRTSASHSPESSSLENALFYHAPDLPSPATRVVVNESQPGQEPLYLAVLSPDHIGLTMFEQPALFWFIAYPTSQPVDVTITDESHTQRLLDVRMLPPIQPGIHKVDLRDYGIRLQLNMTYQWKIVLQGLNPGESHTTSGWIMRVPPPANVATLANLPSINATPTKPLLEAGLWYDAIWALSERLHTDPADTQALIQRANLFEQVGLLPPAKQDRAHLHLP
ncbi:MAG: DUF928 domain-containing protein [Nitrospirota bacterium]